MGPKGDEPLQPAGHRISQLPIKPGAAFFRRHLQPVCLILGFIAAAASPLQASVAPETLQGSIKQVSAAPATGPVNPHRPFISRTTLHEDEKAAVMDFEVALKMRNLPELQNRVAHRERISAQEMASKYNPPAADYQKVVDWLTGQGFEITRRDSNHLAVFALGKVSHIHDAMNVTFARIALEGKEYTSAITPPQAPPDIAVLLVGINGLQPHLHMHKHLIERPQSLTSTNPPYLPSQIATAYNATPLYNANITGAGQAIAIVIDTFPNYSDLTSFWSTYRVNQSSSNITFIQVVAGAFPPPRARKRSTRNGAARSRPGRRSASTPRSRSPSPVSTRPTSESTGRHTHPEYGIHQMSMSYGIGEQYTTKSQVRPTTSTTRNWPRRA